MDIFLVVILPQPIRKQGSKLLLLSFQSGESGFHLVLTVVNIPR